MSHLLDDDDVFYRVAFKEHYLPLRTAKYRRESDFDEYSRKYEAIIQEVRFGEDDEEVVTEAGYIDFTEVKVGLVHSDGADFFSFFDSEGWLMDIGELLFDFDTHDLKDEVTDVISQPIQSNLLVIHEIQLLPQFRGKGLGREIIKCLMEEYADSCGLAFLDIYPSQCWEHLDEERKKALRLDQLEPDATIAMTKLTNYFQSLGFARLLGSNYLVFNLDYTVPYDDQE